MNLKKILIFVLWVLFAASFFVMVGFVEVEQQKVICKGLDINFDQADEHSFLTRAEIVKAIYQLMGDSAEGKPMKDISISLIKQRLEENEYISRAIVFATVDGWITVRISQRTPIIRVQNLKGENFYISDDGRMIPVSFKYSARLPVCNGIITETYDTSRDLVPADTSVSDIDDKISALQKVYLLGQCLKKNQLIAEQTEQVYINKYGEFELVPLLGDHTVIVGDANDLQEKVDKLGVFYTKALKDKGWNTYKTINIKFKNQVICSKN
jgi:cell division protein FtsQ